MPARPIRVKIKNELGIPTTLPEGEQYFQAWGDGPDTLVLCPGPAPALCLPLLTGQGETFLLSVPDFENQMPDDWRQDIPPTWKNIRAEEIARLPPKTRIVLYSPVTRIFPSIFAPVLARQRTRSRSIGSITKEILLPSLPDSLIVHEVTRAAEQCGLTPRVLPANITPEALALMLDKGSPSLFLSVNFHGLDPFGENQSVLESAGVPVAVWCVDNPFHLLSAQKNLLWKQLPLFVTDSWFLEPLKLMGVHPIHLPLATDPALFAPKAACPDAKDIVFVGRSRFPDRDRFFAAASVPVQLEQEAVGMRGRHAHFGWWSSRLKGDLWPGNHVRNIGLGAERLSERWRSHCLRHVSIQSDLTIIGDPAWADLVPGARLRPPVDYYHGLAEVYRQASFTLNLTSLLLPHGLTQRHFDVWACGGFLLSDHTPGLDIFPQHLVQPVCFETPDQVAELIQNHAGAPRRKQEIRRAWQDLILQEHTYAHRLQKVLEYVGRAAH